MIPIGFTLQPEEKYLALCEPLFELADYFEIAPETTWRRGADGGLVPNGFHARFRDIQQRSQKPCVAHGVAFSVGSAKPDAARRARWLERLREDARAFEYGWYSDHLGATELDGRSLVLPLALPYTDEAAAAVRASLAAMQSVVPDVGVETSAFYAYLGDPLDEPGWLARVLDRPRMHLVLDLHNVFTNARNAGFDAWSYVEHLPLERVIEIHLSGGSESDPMWLRSRATLRLDSHDDAVPEEVWSLFERALPRCANVRGITLERMEGTVDLDDVPELADELERARSIAEAVGAR